MNVIEAWKSGHTGKGITIAIVDNGVDIKHPDLKANIVSLWKKCISIEINIW